MAIQDDVCRPIATNDVILPFWPQHAGFGHHQHAIHVWLRSMPAEWVEPRGGTKGVRASKTKQNAAAEFHLIAVSQSGGSRRSTTINLNGLERFDHKALARSAYTGMFSRQVAEN